MFSDCLVGTVYNNFLLQLYTGTSSVTWNKKNTCTFCVFINDWWLFDVKFHEVLWRWWRFQLFVLPSYICRAHRSAENATFLSVHRYDLNFILLKVHQVRARFNDAFSTNDERQGPWLQLLRNTTTYFIIRKDDSSVSSSFVMKNFWYFIAIWYLIANRDRCNEQYSLKTHAE